MAINFRHVVAGCSVILLVETRAAVARDLVGGHVAFEMEAEWLDAGRHLYLSDQIVWHFVLQAVHELRASGQDRPMAFDVSRTQRKTNAERAGFAEVRRE